MEASANFADASILMRKIGFVVVLLRGFLLPIGGFVPKFEHGASRVNLWAWAQEEKSWKVYDEEQNNRAPSHKAEAFGQIYDILQGMRAYG